jgi:hypothetical protein
MYRGTNGCMYNCGDSCTGECMKPMDESIDKKGLDAVMRRDLATKILMASNSINRAPKANYIHLSEEYIWELANKEEITFEEAVKSIEDLLNPENGPTSTKNKL